jgi:hypothetical protein
MTGLTIDRFASRLRLPYAVPEARERLDATTDRLLNALPEALEVCGLPPSVRICIRSLGVRIRVPAYAFGDVQGFTQIWAEAIVAAIKDSYAGGARAGMLPMISSGDGQVIIYRNDAAALADVVESVARGNLGRRWAWQQLHLIAETDPADPVSMIISGCRSLQQIALHVLVDAAHRGWLDHVAITWPQWQQLAEAALPQPSRSRVPSFITDDKLIIETAAAAIEWVQATLQLSPLKPIMIRAVAVLGPPPVSAQPQLAELALAAGAPELIGSTELIKIAARQLFTPEVRSDPDEAIEATDVPRSDYSPLVAEPVQLWTRFAGLLFLLNLNTIQRLADSLGATTGHRRLSWFLVAIACRLSGGAIDDPAILAFAGLPPAGPVAKEILDPPSQTDDDELQVLADQIREELVERLPKIQLPREQLVSFVVARTGRIIADPGWIELIMPLDSVDIELRRAGLDLDPGPVGFLRCVVRFRYE